MVTHLRWDHNRRRLVSAVEREGNYFAGPCLKDSVIKMCLKGNLHISMCCSKQTHISEQNVHNWDSFYKSNTISRRWVSTICIIQASFWTTLNDGKNKFPIYNCTAWLSSIAFYGFQYISLIGSYLLEHKIICHSKLLWPIHITSWKITIVSNSWYFLKQKLSWDTDSCRSDLMRVVD